MCHTPHSSGSASDHVLFNFILSLFDRSIRVCSYIHELILSVLHLFNLLTYLKFVFETSTKRTEFMETNIPEIKFNWRLAFYNLHRSGESYNIISIKKNLYPDYSFSIVRWFYDGDFYYLTKFRDDTIDYSVLMIDIRKLTNSDLERNWL